MRGAVEMLQAFDATREPLAASEDARSISPPRKRAVSISAPAFFLTQPQVKLASGGCGVRCMTHSKPVDRSPSRWEIQKGGSPFGRFKGFPKGENEIPLWRAFFAALPRFFPTTGKKWGNIPCSAMRDAVRFFLISRLRRQLPPEGEALEDARRAAHP